MNSLCRHKVESFYCPHDRKPSVYSFVTFDADRIDPKECDDRLGDDFVDAVCAKHFSNSRIGPTRNRNIFLYSRYADCTQEETGTGKRVAIIHALRQTDLFRQSPHLIFEEIVDRVQLRQVAKI